MMLMPMVYISKRTLIMLDDILEYLKENTEVPSRVLKADVIQVALEEYAKKLGLKVE